MTEDASPQEPNAEPAPTAVSRDPVPQQPLRPAVWSYFLTPIAILIGAAAIVVAIVLTDDDAAPAAPAPATLRDVLDGYAASLGLEADRFGECLADPATYEAVGAQLQRGIDLGVNGTPTFFVNNKLISGAQPAGIFTEVIAAELAGPPTSIDEYSPAVRRLAEQEPPGFAILPARPDLAGAFIEGNTDASVVIVEFSDFQCPFCRRWYSDSLPEIRKYIGENVALAFLHFPLAQIHPNAAAAHVAAECAGAQGKFWEMHDLLYEEQDEWSRLPNVG